MALYLVVANQTIGGDELIAELDDLIDQGPCAFRYVVPVTETAGRRQWDYPPIDRSIADAYAIAAALAQGRLDTELARLRLAQVEADGEVVDSDPLERIKELLDKETYDGIVVSTLPRRLSRWLVMDLPHRVARLSDVPVTQIESSAGPSL